eukprot:ANDGO_08339.mRNA.1 Catalase-2
MVDHFSKIDFRLACGVAELTGAAPPTTDSSTTPRYLAPEVSMERGANHQTIRSTKIAVLCAHGFDGVQYYECLRRMHNHEGAVVELVAPYGGVIRSVGGDGVAAAKTLKTASGVLYDAVYVPGGRGSVDSLLKLREAVRFLDDMYVHGKPICASNEGVDLLAISRCGRFAKLADAHLLVDKGVVTTRNVMKDRSEFLDACVAAGKQIRFWDVRKDDVAIP